VRVNHPIHPSDREAMAGMCSMISAMKGSVTGPSFREAFDALMEATPAVDGVTHEKAEVGAVPGGWCRPNDAAADAAALYLHGGAHVVSPTSLYYTPPGKRSTISAISCSNKCSASLRGRVDWLLIRGGLAVDGRQGTEENFPF
jgi:hypothetical protein